MNFINLPLSHRLILSQKDKLFFIIPRIKAVTKKLIGVAVKKVNEYNTRQARIRLSRLDIIFSFDIMKPPLI